MTSHSLDVLSDLEIPVSDAVVARVLAPAATPVPPRPSASVVLLRQRDGLQVYLMHRHPRMAFAASMVAFPGGGVDPVDREAGDPVLACAVRELAEETGVRVGGSALAPWAHWITPEVEPRRYDTTFYVTALADGQEPADISGETTSADWADPAETVQAFRAGALGLMPPTLSILIELAGHGSVAAVLEAARDREVHPVLPVPERCDGRWRFRYPRREDA